MGAGVTKLCPQDAQNLPGLIKVLHDGQAIRLAKVAPHSLQNLAPSLLSALQVGHWTLMEFFLLNAFNLEFKAHIDAHGVGVNHLENDPFLWAA